MRVLPVEPPYLNPHLIVCGGDFNQSTCEARLHNITYTEEFQMIIYIANGNPVIATVLMSLSTFKTTALIASFRSIKLSFDSEEAANNFAEEARNLGGLNSKLESTDVVVIPDFSGSLPAARAIYRAVDAYKDSLISVNEFIINPFTEEDNSLLEEIERYLKMNFGSDAVTIAATDEG